MGRQIRALERKLYKLFGEVVSLPERRQEPILDRIERYDSIYEKLTGQRYDLARAFQYKRME